MDKDNFHNKAFETNISSLSFSKLCLSHTREKSKALFHVQYAKGNLHLRESSAKRVQAVRQRSSKALKHLLLKSLNVVPKNEQDNSRRAVQKQLKKTEIKLKHFLRYFGRL